LLDSGCVDADLPPIIDTQDLRHTTCAARHFRNNRLP
jgi:hypothetical protein